MNILILGGGGREHAIGWALARSPDCEKLYFAPGNAGTASLGSNIDISATDGTRILQFCRDQHIGLVVIGPEQPLVLGIADALRAGGVPVMGPSADAAQLEGSKSFAKDFMNRYGIPTAAYRTFSADKQEEALSYMELEGAPIVVKASGLAGGKGAIVCETVEAARDAVLGLMERRMLGDAGDEIVIESFMHGEEASVFVLTDGAYAPAPVVTPDLMARIRDEIIEPTLEGMRRDGTVYQGVLYCGIMITEDGPKVVEYNCRFGDPETQIVLPLIKSDVLDLFYRSATGTLSAHNLRVENGSAACVVMASHGYPGGYEVGKSISGIADASTDVHTIIFHAGTRTHGDDLVTAGGRVLSVAATGRDLEEAIRRAYAGCDKISFEGAYYRTDIGRKGLARSVNR
jgi:phosphoribosylamine--glycine ligase